MKSLFIITVGISGSGKNHLLDQLQKYFSQNLISVEPDDIRRKVLGDVNDQSRGNEIFAIAEKEVRVALNKNKIVYFNATNLGWGRLKKSIKAYTEDKCPTLVLFMMDSANINLCKSRVKKDIDNNVDRSKVPEDIIDNQSERWIITHANAILDKDIENIDIIEFKGDTHNLIKQIVDITELSWDGD